MSRSDLTKGDRVELVYMGQDPDPVSPGTQGTVSLVVDHGEWTQVAVDWDNGRSLMAVVPPDQLRRLDVREVAR